MQAFMSKVERGIYSQPKRERGCLPKWFRTRLDQDIAQRHGFRGQSLPIAENLEHLI
ncbi:hypothetical protein Q8W71_17865 [Methylobacterium sp. NEAU 140]|uniref:hypothetical protein n=1 Tax=Methylobacterium sp. NEAU 140 TaxID=3064945 RepID=UPI002737713D|nr:hypothetical protein [Methylobacterium sp. NEAU 140]MDP4024494.1 hypothetical protein [Methylobacterium sp. NEAU 140]